MECASRDYAVQRGKGEAAVAEGFFKLLYDGACPFCRLEVRWLRRWNRKGRLAFEDISSPEFDPARYGLTREQVQAVLHGVSSEGTVLRGMEAFRRAYRTLGLGWLLAPTGWPVLRPLFDGMYRCFARRRVGMGRLFGRSCPDGTCAKQQPSARGPSNKA